MLRLTQGQVGRIIGATEGGIKLVCSIAKKWDITPRWIRELWRRPGCGREAPVIKEAGLLRTSAPGIFSLLAQP